MIEAVDESHPTLFYRVRITVPTRKEDKVLQESQAGEVCPVFAEGRTSFSVIGIR